MMGAVQTSEMLVNLYQFTRHCNPEDRHLQAIYNFCDISFALQVKYKGKKLDAYKNTWFKKRKQDQNKETEVSDGKFLH
jgi:hypothetical protein